MPTFDPFYPYGAGGPSWQPSIVNVPGNFTYLAPPRFHVPNKRVALEPFPDTAAAPKIVNGVLQVKMNGLTGLKVVFGNENFPEGSICYIRSDRNRTSTWGKAEASFDVDGKKFILVPEDEIILVDRHGGVDFTIKTEPASAP
jgi:hypothetical protein